MDTQANAASCGCPDQSSVRHQTAQYPLFFRNFLRHPARIGWAFPSSEYLVDTVLNAVDWQTTRCLVEYGPGIGTFTKHILERLRPDARLVALEIDPEFCRFLRANLGDPRFHLVQESAAHVQHILGRLGLNQVDCVVSGIPFKPLPPKLRHEIVQKTQAVLRPDGMFLVYQFSGAVHPYLRQHFRSVRQGLEMRNLLPTRIFFCHR